MPILLPIKIEFSLKLIRDSFMATMRNHQRIICFVIVIHNFWIINGQTVSKEIEVNNKKTETSPAPNVAEGDTDIKSEVTHNPTNSIQSTLVSDQTSVLDEFATHNVNLMPANLSRRSHLHSIAAEDIDKAIDSKTKPEDSLRHGSHHLNLCKIYEKQYICRRKCLETGFDEGHTDKNCRCTCYKENNFNLHTATGKQEKEATTTTGKAILRYGIHKLSLCKDYAKQYICTRKCIDTGFDEGRTDKNCNCSCYKIEDFKQYTKPRRKNMTKWLSGAPKTTKPSWAKGKITTAKVKEGPTLGAFRCDYTFNASADGWFKLHYLMNWNDANATCIREGAELVAPNSKSLKEAVLAIIQREGLEGIHTRRRVLGQANNKTNATVRYDSLSEILLPNGFYKTGSKSDFYPFICYKNFPELVKVTECGTVDPEYKRSEEDRCYKFHPSFVTWCDALRVCVAEGAFLTILSNKEDIKSLKKLIADDWNDFYNKHTNDTVNEDAASNAFVGIWSTNSGETWTTLRGGLVSDRNYDKWQPGRPSANKPANSFCAKINKKELSYLDEPCDSFAPFICEKSLSSTDICNNPITKPKLDAIFRICRV